MKLLLPLSCLLLFSSCWVRSIEPFYQVKDRDSIALEGLTGLWIHVEEAPDDGPPELTCFEFGARQEGPGYDMTVYQSGASAVILEAHVFQVGDQLFLDTSFDDFLGDDLEDVPMMFLSHIQPVHLAWAIRRSDAGIELGLLDPDDARAGLAGASLTDVPRVAKDPYSHAPGLLLTGPSASVQRVLEQYPKEPAWLRLRRIQALPDSFRTSPAGG